MRLYDVILGFVFLTGCVIVFSCAEGFVSPDFDPYLDENGSTGNATDTSTNTGTNGPYTSTNPDTSTGTTDTSIGPDTSTGTTDTGTGPDTSTGTTDTSTGTTDTSTGTTPVCAQPRKMCGDDCLDVLTDVNNCGDCEVVCQESQPHCVAGQCSVCPNPGEELCGDECVDVLSNLLHCGTCSNACSPDESCNRGTCSSHCLDNWRDSTAGQNCLTQTQGDIKVCEPILDCLIAEQCESVNACTDINGDICNEASGTQWPTYVNAVWNEMCN